MHARVDLDLDLDQSLATEHALANLTDDVLAVLLAHQNNTTTTLTHTTETAQTVDEVNGCVRHVVENHCLHCQGINTTGGDIGSDKNLCVGKTANGLLTVRELEGNAASGAVLLLINHDLLRSRWELNLCELREGLLLLPGIGVTR